MNMRVLCIAKDRKKNINGAPCAMHVNIFGQSDGALLPYIEHLRYSDHWRGFLSINHYLKKAWRRIPQELGLVRFVEMQSWIEVKERTQTFLFSSLQFFLRTNDCTLNLHQFQLQHDTLIKSLHCFEVNREAREFVNKCSRKRKTLKTSIKALLPVAFRRCNCSAAHIHPRATMNARPMRAYGGAWIGLHAVTLNHITNGWGWVDENTRYDWIYDLDSINI